MSEKIVVNNFACIQKAEIEFNKITILIGPQATGKSIIAKLSYFFKQLPHIFVEDGSEALSKINLEKKLTETFEKYFPKKYFINQKFSIIYSSGDDFIKVYNDFAKTKSGSLKIEYSDIYNQIRLDYKKYFKYFTNHPQEESDKMRNYFEEPSTRALSKVNSKYVQYFNYSIFIPAGRSFYSNIENIIFTLLSKNQDIDPFIQEFGSFYESIKRRPRPLRRTLSSIENLKDVVLRGDFYQENGKDFLKLKDGRIIDMANASSGQQEVLPLYLALNWLLLLRPSDRRRSIYIEEPEAHLFPDAQYLLVEAIGLIFNRHVNNISFIITTHSPYILTTFNNLTFASTVINEANIKEASGFINTDAVIKSENLSAFATSNKGVKKIICGETGLIDAESIDSISNKLSMQFDKLLTLEEMPSEVDSPDEARRPE